MRVLAVLGNPWCLFSLLLLIILLLVAGALVSRSRQRSRVAPRQVSSPPRGPDRLHQLVATAPLEALQALSERLAELQRHLPPNSDGARWLEGYRNDLRNVQDDVYWGLFNASGAERTALLNRLGQEVGQLEQTVGERLSTTISATTDRDALHAQLDHLRRAVSR